MTYLFLGGHVDEEVCFGGTIIKLVQQGHYVQCRAHSLGTSNDSEFINSNLVMGSYVCYRPLTEPQKLADDLFNLRNDFDFIFTHSINDRHSLHRMVAEESRRVFNGNLFTYVAPWNANEDPNYFIELSEEHLQKKIEALSCYKSQSHRSYMNPDFIRSQAIYNGIKCNRKYAEAFRIEKLIA